MENRTSERTFWDLEIAWGWNRWGICPNPTTGGRATPVVVPTFRKGVREPCRRGSVLAAVRLRTPACALGLVASAQGANALWLAQLPQWGAWPIRPSRRSAWATGVLFGNAEQQLRAEEKRRPRALYPHVALQSAAKPLEEVAE